MSGERNRDCVHVQQVCGRKTFPMQQVLHPLIPVVVACSCLLWCRAFLRKWQELRIHLTPSTCMGCEDSKLLGRAPS
jgi:hypothetical protein